MRSGNKRFQRFLLFLILTPFTWLLTTTSGFTLNLQVSTEEAAPGNSVVVAVTVDDYVQERIAAAAFTLNYSTDYLTLTNIESAFFTSFDEQWSLLPSAPDPLPPSSVEVDGQTYTSPLLFQTINGSPAGRTMLAAARVTAGTPSSLFTLHFTLSPNVPPGTYPVTITPTTLDNVNAGYNQQGETVPVLYGFVEGENNPALAYPAYEPSIINGGVVVQGNPDDTDDDGIDDTWERDNFGDLVTATAESDYDKDGLKDIDEFGLSTNPTLRDTDGDGVSDATEVTLGSDPLNGEEFARALYAGFNLVSIPSDISTQPSLNDWLPTFGDNSVVDKVMAYNIQTETFASFVPGALDNPVYNLSNGDGLIVYASKNATIVFTVVDCLSVNLVAGLNMVGFTCAPEGYTAFDLLNALGRNTIISIQAFNAVTGSFETAAFEADGQPSGVNFPILPGEGYFVFMKTGAGDFTIAP